MDETANMCQGVADLIAEGRLEAERRAEEARRREQKEKQRADEAIGLLKTAARNLAADSSSWTAARIGKLLGQPEERIGEWLASGD